jgi:hypothetical protein
MHAVEAIESFTMGMGRSLHTFFGSLPDDMRRENWPLLLACQGDKKPMELKQPPSCGRFVSRSIVPPK